MDKNFRAVFCAALTSLAFLAVGAIAGPYEDAIEASKRRDYESAFKLLTVAANEGNAKAQTSLGGMYLEGVGVKRSDADGAKWLHEAALNGDSTAEFYLAVLYDIGRGVQKDEAEAAKWARSATNHGIRVTKYLSMAIEGNPEAQQSIGSLYRVTTPVGFYWPARDHARAAEWLLRAAVQGDRKAQYELSEVFQKGDGVTQDYIQAYKWAVLAKPEYVQVAPKKLEELSKQMTSAQIAEAEKLAEEWKPKREK